MCWRRWVSKSWEERVRVRVEVRAEACGLRGTVHWRGWKKGRRNMLENRVAE